MEASQKDFIRPVIESYIGLFRNVEFIPYEKHIDVFLETYFPELANSFRSILIKFTFYNWHQRKNKRVINQIIKSLEV